jgi:hypothetical protein
MRSPLQNRKQPPSERTAWTAMPQVRAAPGLLLLQLTTPRLYLAPPKASPSGLLYPPAYLLIQIQIQNFTYLASRPPYQGYFASNPGYFPFLRALPSALPTATSCTYLHTTTNLFMLALPTHTYCTCNLHHPGHSSAHQGHPHIQVTSHHIQVTFPPLPTTPNHSQLTTAPCHPSCFAFSLFVTVFFQMPHLCWTAATVFFQMPCLISAGQQPPTAQFAFAISFHFISLAMLLPNSEDTQPCKHCNNTSIPT